MSAFKNIQDVHMTKELALEMLQVCAESGDTEAAHCDADDILCALLEALGYGDVVEKYNSVDKWFA